MINVSDGFRAAIVGVSRRMMSRAVVEIIDPDITYGESRGSGTESWAKPEQLHDKQLTSDIRYGTLEPGRWLLDGKTAILPDSDADVRGQIAHVGNVLCDRDGYFDGTAYAEQPISNVSVLQVCSAYFPTDPADGIPTEFRVAIMSGETEVFSKTFTGNTASSVAIKDFTVYAPTAIRVYPIRWSIGRRRLRVLEIIPGLFEEWSLSNSVSIDIEMRGNFASLALPYGTAYLRVKNTDRRFEPFSRSGMFRSIEERQAIPISMGPVQADGTVEYAPVGVFFQRSGGWDTGRNDMYIDWTLVDICGLLSDRDFQIPDELPTTLAGWFQCFVAQLGKNFTDWWHVDPDYADLPLTINDRSQLLNRKCGAMIRYACMATGTWPRADQETGYLTAEPLWSQGSKILLNQIYSYPTKKANDTLSEIRFKIYDGTDSGTIYTVSGNSTSSSKNLSVDNPFIHTTDMALTAARQILSQYGGIKISTVGRGNPATEIGDVDTIWVSQSEAKTARRMEQSFRIVNGKLKNCRDLFLQPDGSFMFENRETITASGTWKAPAGATQLRLILVGGGSGSTGGTDGTYNRAGVDGVDGVGGMIWAGTIDINPEQEFAVTIGQGGAEGQPGTATVFGLYSSANGKRYEPSYADIGSGDAYGRTGVKKPRDGTGDGGRYGAGGQKGEKRIVRDYTVNGTLPGNTSGVYIEKEVILTRPGVGEPGVPGAAGCVVVYWDKEADA